MSMKYFTISCPIALIVFCVIEVLSLCEDPLLQSDFQISSSVILFCFHGLDVGQGPNIQKNVVLCQMYMYVSCFR